MKTYSSFYISSSWFYPNLISLSISTQSLHFCPGLKFDLTNRRVTALKFSCRIRCPPSNIAQALFIIRILFSKACRMLSKGTVGVWSEKAKNLGFYPVGYSPRSLSYVCAFFLRACKRSFCFGRFWNLASYFLSLRNIFGEDKVT